MDKIFSRADIHDTNKNINAFWLESDLILMVWGRIQSYKLNEKFVKMHLCAPQRRSVSVTVTYLPHLLLHNEVHSFQTSLPSFLFSWEFFLVSQIIKIETVILKIFFNTFLKQKYVYLSFYFTSITIPTSENPLYGLKNQIFTKIGHHKEFF